MSDTAPSKVEELFYKHQNIGDEILIYSPSAFILQRKTDYGAGMGFGVFVGLTIGFFAQAAMSAAGIWLVCILAAVFALFYLINTFANKVLDGIKPSMSCSDVQVYMDGKWMAIEEARK